MPRLLIAAALVALPLAPVFAAEDLRPTEREEVVLTEEMIPRDEHSRLVRSSRRVIRKSGGEDVVITRRVYENSAGDRTVRESRQPLDRL